MPPGDPTCASCKWYQIHDGHGCCRRRAPVAIPQCQGRSVLVHEDAMVVWPLVDTADWCGDYEKKVP